MEYVSFKDFFQTLRSVISDAKIEFNTEKYSNYTDMEYDIKYRTFITRLRKFCSDFSSEWFFGPAEFVRLYVAEIAATRDMTRGEIRFDSLLEITEKYLKKCV